MCYNIIVIDPNYSVHANWILCDDVKQIKCVMCVASTVYNGFKLRSKYSGTTLA